MKYINKFRLFENISVESVEDLLLGFAEEWNIIKSDEVKTPLAKYFIGCFEIKKVSTNYFGVKGFPHKKKGILISIYVLRGKMESDKMDKFEIDLSKFIQNMIKNFNLKIEDYFKEDKKENVFINYYIPIIF